MSNYLAVDTSSKYLTVAARKNGKIVVRHLPQCAMQHSVILMDEIDKVLNQTGLAPAECDFFAAVTGPGSFTGIRIGVAIVKGFALATGKPLLSVTSFDLLAYNVTDENFCVVIDASRGHYYACGYGKGRTVVRPPAYLTEEEIYTLGMPLYGFEELDLKNYRRLDVKDCLPTAVGLNESRLSNDMFALYVRKSQAEEARGES